MASPSTVLTQGLGVWGTVYTLVTLGFGIGASVTRQPSPLRTVIASADNRFPYVRREDRFVDAANENRFVDVR
jgi:hypothetical protein